MDNPEKLVNKRQRIPKGQSKMDNPEKLATYGTQDTGRRQTKQKQTIQRNWQHMVHKTQDEDKQNKNTQANTNNVNETQALLQTTGG